MSQVQVPVYVLDKVDDPRTVNQLWELARMDADRRGVELTSNQPITSRGSVTVGDKTIDCMKEGYLLYQFTGVLEVQDVPWQN